jgi:hypothetical protein
VAGGLAVGRCVAWVSVLSSVIPVDGWVVCPLRRYLLVDGQLLLYLSWGSVLVLLLNLLRFKY